MSEYIEIVDARTHNLKGVHVKIPKNTLTVITGVSGSGKSSLAFDTLYAEGQRRYLESLSTYARMIIGDSSKQTEVSEIRWLSPTIAINQKTVSNNPRSTVWTITEIYDFYRLLFTHIWVPYCPNHPDVSLVKSFIDEVYRDIELYEENTKFYVLFPLKFDAPLTFSGIQQKVTELWFVRFLIGKDVYSVADENQVVNFSDSEEVYVVVDRLIKRSSEDFSPRLRDSLLIAKEKWPGKIGIYRWEESILTLYNFQSSCLVCGYTLGDTTLSNFSFNSPQWACEHCFGLWYRTTFLEKDIIHEDLSLLEWALLPWQSHNYRMSILVAMAKKQKIPLDVPYKNLTEKQKKHILYGVDWKFEAEFTMRGRESSLHSARYEWLIPLLERQYAESTSKSDAYMRYISNFTTEQECRVCHGYRLKSDFLSIRIGGKNIGEVSGLSVEDSLDFFRNLTLSRMESLIAAPIVKNILERLEFLEWVWLSYVTMSRRANTLSWWESQRIRLATQIGTRLEWIIYVLDEPSIGLHPKDNDMLIQNLKKLSQIGNTVIVVEHDEDIMRESDYIIDVWPGAWVHGGNIIFSGTYSDLIQSWKTDTAEYLTGRKRISRNHPVVVGKKKFLMVYGAKENNLKNINVRIPLECMTVVTGVSGSGKSSLIMDILSNVLLNHFNKSALPVWRHDRVEGMSNIDKVIIIDQSPIGKTPHSNIATYTGVFTLIREVFAASNDAKKRWFWPGRFSFNTKWGRCEICEWTGVKKIEMHFLSDMYVECDACHGTRYNSDTLSVQFKGRNIADVLAMTIDEAVDFFKAFPRILRILNVLQDVWLGYISLWQSAPTLSWGESQRIKLAFDLAKRSTGKTLYILDEPTTGLHFADVQKLLDILDRLVEKWNSVLVIEHNLDIIANADAIIDIGPAGWNAGWNLLFAWPKEKLLAVEESYTAEALRRYLGRSFS